MPMSCSIKSPVDSSARHLSNPQSCYDAVNAQLYGNSEFPAAAISVSCRPRLAGQYKNKEPHRKLSYIQACEKKAWSIGFWLKSNPDSVKVTCFRCHSWRHSGDCLRWKNSQDFSRILSAITEKSGDWTYLVLTVDRHLSLFDSYRALYSSWSRLRKRLFRRYGKFFYVAVCEQHRDGFPHINLLVNNAVLHKLSEECWRKERQIVNRKVVQCGFGLRFWLEPVRSLGGIAGYFVKLFSEIVKRSQTPVCAPRNFRRLRSSQKFLPPVHHNPDVSGCLIQEPEEVSSQNARHFASVAIFGAYSRSFRAEWLKRIKWTQSLVASARLTLVREAMGLSSPTSVPIPVARAPSEFQSAFNFFYSGSYSELWGG